MPNEVLETEAFARLFGLLEKTEQEWIKKIIRQLENNPKTGKPLGYDWFREKKFKGKRLYYLSHQKTNKILLVSFGKKKQQQKIIDHVLENKERYLKIVKGN